VKTFLELSGTQAVALACFLLLRTVATAVVVTAFIVELAALERQTQAAVVVVLLVLLVLLAALAVQVLLLFATRKFRWVYDNQLNANRLHRRQDFCG
jgi:hypothetical protein